MRERGDEGSRGRVVGRFDTGRSGATLVCVAGVHGNEPAAVEALRRVFEGLEGRDGGTEGRRDGGGDRADEGTRDLGGEGVGGGCGRFVGLVGNLSALRLGQRFVDTDLNRVWTPELVERVRDGGARGLARVEDREQRELLEALEREFAAADGDVYFIDMHTTSASGGPFVVLSDTLRNRGFALCFPVPVVLGLEERVGGTLPGYASDLGHITMGFEAGQHDDPASVDVHEAAVWVALFAAGVVDERDVPEAGRHRALLEKAGRDLPRLVDIRHRHAVQSGDGFKMRAGFENFQLVRAGEELARDRRGPIVSPVTGRILLPLYQAQGNDGFFVVRPVRRLWLVLSAWFRRFRLGAVAHWLPGVRRHPERRNTLLVNPGVARWGVRNFFHLLGFRERHRENGQLVFMRREQSGIVVRDR